MSGESVVIEVNFVGNAGGTVVWDQEVEAKLDAIDHTVKEVMIDTRKKQQADCSYGLNPEQCHLKALFNQTQRHGAFVCRAEVDNPGRMPGTRMTNLSCDGAIAATKDFAERLQQ